MAAITTNRNPPVLDRHKEVRISDSYRSRAVTGAVSGALVKSFGTHVLTHPPMALMTSPFTNLAGDHNNMRRNYILA